MENKINTEESAAAIREKIEKYDKVTCTAADMDMMPLLRPDRDSLTLVKPNGKLKKNDVALYQSDSGQQKLSRVVFVNGETYVMCGDGVKANEYNVRDEQIIGVMESFVRKDKTYKTDSIEYIRYLKLLPVIKVIYGIYNSLRIRTLNFIKYLTRK